MVVLQQVRFDEYRAIQSVQDKAWVAGNGCSLDKAHNAVLSALACSLRASQKGVIRVVAPFVKGTTIHSKTPLAANVIDLIRNLLIFIALLCSTYGIYDDQLPSFFG